MPTRKACLHRNPLGTVVDKCLQRLRILALNLDIYGSEEAASNLREVIAELETASPQKPERPAADFVVQGLFKVRRAQVANLLCCAFDESAPRRFEIVDFVQPPAFGFRAHPALAPLHLDYPLNEGGSLGIRERGDSELFRLDLKSIASGLNSIASECPRHFADFVNENADSITGDAFLQCCFFGEMIY
jgi:hypothetical protein